MVRYDPKKATLQQLQQAIVDGGYAVTDARVLD